MTRRTIPQIRERLHELAKELCCPELHALAEETKREFHGRIAPVRSKLVSEAVADEIRRTAENHPLMSQQEIALRVGVNAGRVSETLFGKRG
jgi:hypothetical protein